MELQNKTIINRLSNWIRSYSRNDYLQGSILVAVKDQILLNEGFGKANRNFNISNSANTKYRIGSITKGITAAAIFKLHEEKKLHIHDSIDNYFPNYPNGKLITIYHCLTHTSGIPNFTSFPDFWFITMRLSSSFIEIINSFKDYELEFKPGTQSRYSNSGYLLLTAIIEKVSGNNYADYVDKKLFIPLEMRNTGCDNGRTIIPNLANGYTYWERPLHAEFTDLSFPTGAYGLYSTTEDLFKWITALKSFKLLNHELTNQMFKLNQDSFASGWNISQIGKRKCISKFGDISGYVNEILYFEEDEVTIIILSNMNITPVMKITRDIAKIVFGEEVNKPEEMIAIPMEYPNEYSGIYIEDKQNLKTIELSIKDTQLFLSVAKMYGVVYKFKLIPIQHNEMKTTFITECINEKLIINYLPDNSIDNVEYIDYDEKYYQLRKSIN